MCMCSFRAKMIRIDENLAWEVESVQSLAQPISEPVNCIVLLYFV